MLNFELLTFFSEGKWIKINSFAKELSLRKFKIILLELLKYKLWRGPLQVSFMECIWGSTETDSDRQSFYLNLKYSLYTVSPIKTCAQSI